MRIAYIAPYQGPELVKRRPIVRNLSLAGRVKVERLAELLQECSHDVEIISQGEVVDRRLRFYPAFSEREPFRSDIPVYYASALPLRFVNALWSSLNTLRILKARHRVAPFDLVLIYNLKAPQVYCAKYAWEHLRIPVILEYEDGAFGKDTTASKRRLNFRLYEREAKELLPRVSGCLAVSPELLSQTPTNIPKILLRGVISDEIIEALGRANKIRKNRVIFSGTHYRANGLENLISAWKTAGLRGWELHFTGHGVMTNALQQMAKNYSDIIFHGLLSREELADLMCSSRIGINPHVLSHTTGNLFAFKIIEYLAAGTHVITTRMGGLPFDLESGITYLVDNNVATIEATLRKVVEERSYERNAAKAALEHYGPKTVSRLLEQLVQEVFANKIPKKAPLRKD